MQISVEELKNKIPNYVIQIAEELQKNNFEAFLVGGSLRDILLGRTPNDFDIATNAYPDDVVKIFPKSIPVGAKFGTIIVVTEDEKGERFDVEVTTYRSEEDYFGGRWPAKVEFTKTIQEDLKRRDFTINAIALNLQEFDNVGDWRLETGDKKNDENTPLHPSQEGILSDPTTNNRQLTTILIDPYNGMPDIEAKVIRAVGDPVERFSEDGLRAVRACRLASQLEFEIESKTFEAIKQTLHITKQVSIERFRDEFVKILYKSPKPSKGLMLLKESGILEIFIPELLEGIGVEQPQFHVEDVFLHSIRTCDDAEDSIKIAALFHDIGKPRTQSVDEKGVHFYGHDVVGAEMTKKIMQRLRFPNAEIDRTVRLVRWHMFYYPSADWRSNEQNTPLTFPSREGMEGSGKGVEFRNPKRSVAHGWTDGAIRRLIKEVGGEEAIDDLMKLRIADASSNPKTDFNPIELDVLSKRISDVRAKDMALKISDLDITGKDLMENFGLKPGPELGKILDYLLDKVIEEPLYNKKLDLLQLAKEYLKKLKIIN